MPRNGDSLEVTVKGNCFFGRNENVLRLTGVVNAQSLNVLKPLNCIYFKWVNFELGELYLSKIVLKKQLTCGAL